MADSNRFHGRCHESKTQGLRKCGRKKTFITSLLVGPLDVFA